MVNQKELRKGNYVYPCISSGGIILPLDIYSKVFEIKFEGANLALDITKPFAEQVCFDYRYNRIEPIPLTEELVSKLFRKHDNFEMFVFGTWVMYYIEYCPIDDCFNIRVKINDEESLFLKRVDYLHQLQNIYYILEDEELEIKL
jgi:hypothetical protein